jgi:hypothetical protein
MKNGNVGSHRLELHGRDERAKRAVGANSFKPRRTNRVKKHLPPFRSDYLLAAVFGQWCSFKLTMRMSSKRYFAVNRRSRGGSKEIGAAGSGFGTGFKSGLFMRRPSSTTSADLKSSSTTELPRCGKRVLDRLRNRSSSRTALAGLRSRQPSANFTYASSITYASRLVPSDVESSDVSCLSTLMTPDKSSGRSRKFSGAASASCTVTGCGCCAHAVGAKTSISKMMSRIVTCEQGPTVRCGQLLKNI